MRIGVMTGATSGIGAFAAERLRATPDLRLVVGARSRDHAGPDVLPLDLDSLGSVRGFAAAVVQTLNGAAIDILILNAGVNLPSDELRSEDGYERTFAVNHLAHYVLLTSLAAHLADGARVVITTSDLHDPAINKIAPPLTADVDTLAHPRTTGRREGKMKRGLRAYASSKLANILTARAFAEQPETRSRHIEVIAYNPGFTHGTRVGRDAPAALTFLLKVAVPILGLFRTLNRVSDAGGTLADLALGNVKPPAGRSYASLVSRRLEWPDVSELAQNGLAAETFWASSGKLVGV